jgi:hypothetical protein
VQQIIQVLFEFPNTDGTAGQVLQTDGYANLSFATVGGGGKFESALFHVRDEKSSGTAGGGFTSGSFQTRTLNTSVTNEISGASLSSNQIILPTGTYFIIATAPAFLVANHKARLRNITDSSNTLLGTNEYADGNISTTSFVFGRFTIAAQKTFELQHRCAATKTGNGFGVDINISTTEDYSNVMIWKVA